MFWSELLRLLPQVGGLGAVVGGIFLLGRFVQKMYRGEIGDPKLSPIQRLSVDVENLGRDMVREIKALSDRLGVQYTDVVQRFNADHIALRELQKLQLAEVLRLSEHFASRELVAQQFAEASRERATMRAQIDEISDRCYSTHQNGRK